VLPNRAQQGGGYRIFMAEGDGKSLVRSKFDTAGLGYGGSAMIRPALIRETMMERVPQGGVLSQTKSAESDSGFSASRRNTSQGQRQKTKKKRMQIERRHEYDFEDNAEMHNRIVQNVSRLSTGWGTTTTRHSRARRSNAIEEDKEEEFLDEDPYSEGEEPEMRPYQSQKSSSRQVQKKSILTSARHPRKHEKSKVQSRLNLKNVHASRHIVDGVKRDREKAKEDGYVEKEKKKVEVFFHGRRGKVEHWDSALHEERMLDEWVLKEERAKKLEREKEAADVFEGNTSMDSEWRDGEGWIDEGEKSFDTESSTRDAVEGDCPNPTTPTRAEDEPGHVLSPIPEMDEVGQNMSSDSLVLVLSTTPTGAQKVEMQMKPRPGRVRQNKPTYFQHPQYSMPPPEPQYHPAAHAQYHPPPLAAYPTYRARPEQHQRPNVDPAVPLTLPDMAAHTDHHRRLTEEVERKEQQLVDMEKRRAAELIEMEKNMASKQTILREESMALEATRSQMAEERKALLAHEENLKEREAQHASALSKLEEERKIFEQGVADFELKKKAMIETEMAAIELQKSTWEREKKAQIEELDGRRKDLETLEKSLTEAEKAVQEESNALEKERQTLREEAKVHEQVVKDHEQMVQEDNAAVEAEKQAVAEAKRMHAEEKHRHALAIKEEEHKTKLIKQAHDAEVKRHEAAVAAEQQLIENAKLLHQAEVNKHNELLEKERLGLITHREAVEAEKKLHLESIEKEKKLLAQAKQLHDTESSRHREQMQKEAAEREKLTYSHQEEATRHSHAVEDEKLALKKAMEIHEAAKKSHEMHVEKHKELVRNEHILMKKLKDEHDVEVRKHKEAQQSLAHAKADHQREIQNDHLRHEHSLKVAKEEHDRLLANERASHAHDLEKQRTLLETDLRTLQRDKELAEKELEHLRALAVAERSKGETLRRVEESRLETLKLDLDKERTRLEEEMSREKNRIAEEKEILSETRRVIEKEHLRLNELKMESKRDLEHSLQGINLQKDQVKAEKEALESLRDAAKASEARAAAERKSIIKERADISNREKKFMEDEKQMAQERILMQSKVYKERSSMLEQVREERLQLEKDRRQIERQKFEVTMSSRLQEERERVINEHAMKPVRQPTVEEVGATNSLFGGGYQGLQNNPVQTPRGAALEPGQINAGVSSPGGTRMHPSLSSARISRPPPRATDEANWKSIDDAINLAHIGTMDTSYQRSQVMHDRYRSSSGPHVGSPQLTAIDKEIIELKAKNQERLMKENYERERLEQQLKHEAEEREKLEHRLEQERLMEKTNLEERLEMERKLHVQQLQLDRQAMKHTLDSQRHQLDEVRNMMDHIQADGMNGLLKVKDAVMQFDDLVHRVRLEREGGSEIRPRRF
jgi:hypothetical protein